MLRLWVRLPPRAFRKVYQIKSLRHVGFQLYELFETAKHRNYDVWEGRMHSCQNYRIDCQRSAGTEISAFHGTTESEFTTGSGLPRKPMHPTNGSSLLCWQIQPCLTQTGMFVPKPVNRTRLLRNFAMLFCSIVNHGWTKAMSSISDEPSVFWWTCSEMCRLMSFPRKS